MVEHMFYLDASPKRTRQFRLVNIVCDVLGIEAPKMVYLKLL